MRPIVYLPEGCPNPTLLGAPATDHAERLLASLTLPQHDGSLVLDARYLAIAATTLTKLARLPEGGVLLGPNDQPLAVATRDPSLSPAAALALPPDDPLTATAAECLRADDPWDATRLERALVDQHLQALARAGVRLIDPARIWIEPSVTVAAGATLWAGSVLCGATQIGADAEIHPGCCLRDSTIGPRAVIRPHSVLEGASVGADCAVGPMAHLRAGAVLLATSKVGNFVEVKKSVLGVGAKASHLTYLGDCEIGPGANIGAGTITCNYDGHSKHRTTIGAGAFIGSNSALVAPISVGAGAIVGAGSVITVAVPDNAVAVTRAPQRTLADKAPGIHARNRAIAQAGK